MSTSKLSEISGESQLFNSFIATSYFSEVGGHVEIHFYLTLKWFESRLRFKNLNEDTSFNSILPSEKSQIWVPQLVFLNTEKETRTSLDERTSINIERRGTFALSKPFELENIRYYKGAENPLIMRRYYDERFLCNFYMEWYPFDIQRCLMIFTMKQSWALSTKLHVGDLQYQGEKLLRKYQVKSVKMKNVIQSDGTDEIHVEIIFGRQILASILNIFIPTIILNIISYGTNFFNEHKKVVMTINLSAMLVMVTLSVNVR